jgi:hypothetical protein
MYPYMNEEVAWQRLQDLQREMEYSRYLAHHGPSALGGVARRLVGRVRSLMTARPARPADQLREECDSASDAA